MNRIVTKLNLILMMALCACSGGKESPIDSTGKTAERTFFELCELLIDGKMIEAKSFYSDEFLEEFVSSKGITFEDYTSMISNWEKEWLTPKSMGNEYNKDVWRVKMIPDEGKGANNGPGVVYDFHIIDGAWKVVFWNHYPKT